MKLLKHSLFFVLLLSIILTGCNSEDIDKKVATVGEVDILEQDVIFYMGEDVERDTVIKDLVVRELVILEAKKEDISLEEDSFENVKGILEQSLENDEDRKKEIESLAANYELGIDEFVNTIWTSQRKKDLLVNKYFDKHINIELKEDKIEQYEKEWDESYKEISDQLLNDNEDLIEYY